MFEAFGWGLAGGLALVIGAIAGLTIKISTRTIGLIMGFGAGVLISAVSFELTDEAYKQAGADAVGIGLALGAVSFFLADAAVEARGGGDRKSSKGEQSGGAAQGIVIGALMDGIPESLTIGISLLGGGAVALPVVVAVFLSNIPESLAAATGLRKAGRSARWIIGLWIGVALISGLASALGYALLGGASDNIVGGIQAFAAGAILTMLANTMFLKL
jgi:ZIP family zinc transporter